MLILKDKTKDVGYDALLLIDKGGCPFLVSKHSSKKNQSFLDGLKKRGLLQVSEGEVSMIIEAMKNHTVYCYAFEDNEFEEWLNQEKNVLEDGDLIDKKIEEGDPMMLIGVQVKNKQGLLFLEGDKVQVSKKKKYKFKNHEVPN